MTTVHAREHWCQCLLSVLQVIRGLSGGGCLAPSSAGYGGITITSASVDHLKQPLDGHIRGTFSRESTATKKQRTGMPLGVPFLVNMRTYGILRHVLIMHREAFWFLEVSSAIHLSPIRPFVVVSRSVVSTTLSPGSLLYRPFSHWV